MRVVVLLILAPSELFALHLYDTWPPVFKVLIHTPGLSMFGTSLPFSYNMKVSTAGLAASTVHVKLTTTSAQTWLIDKFFLNATFSGGTVQMKKDIYSSVLLPIITISSKQKLLVIKMLSI